MSKQSKKTGINAAAWFSQQSFNGRVQIPAPREWDMLGGDLYTLQAYGRTVAQVSLNCSCGGWNACLYPPRPGAVLGTFKTLAAAQAVCESHEEC